MQEDPARARAEPAVDNAAAPDFAAVAGRVQDRQDGATGGGGEATGGGSKVAQARPRKHVDLYRDFMQATGAPPRDEQGRTDSGESGQGPESKINRHHIISPGTIPSAICRRRFCHHHRQGADDGDDSTQMITITSKAIMMMTIITIAVPAVAPVKPRPPINPTCKSSCSSSA